MFLPQIALGLHEQASWMHTHLVFSLSFHTLIALVHPLHGNPYSLTLISINGHLHSPLIRLVDVRLSSPFCILHNHPSIPHIVLCPWLTLMYCMKNWKKFEITKVWNNYLAFHRGCAWWEHFCVTRMKHSQTIWFCRDKISLAMLFWEYIIA